MAQCVAFARCGGGWHVLALRAQGKRGVLAATGLATHCTGLLPITAKYVAGKGLSHQTSFEASINPFDSISLRAVSAQTTSPP